nr:uncharacterized protein LOC111835233 isoform X1 [Paramormyrops kingsleyae]XP_023651071.1 uncharacterized protein LOC111835233 isoform X1 [Paramormyrops kingsleyae]
MWLCKKCNFTASKRSELLKHYRLKHWHSTRNHSILCPYSDCPCCFRTYSALYSHLSRDHRESLDAGQAVSFRCLVCNSVSHHSEKQYFEHLRGHLKKYETVTCVFNNCEFSTNIYSTFASHKSRRHTPHSLEHFKPSVFQNNTCETPKDTDLSVDESDSCEPVVEEEHDFVKIVNNKLGCLFLKLESVFNVSNRCIDEIVDELQFISSAASRPVIKQIIDTTLQRNSCNVDESVVSDLVENLTSLNPLNAALGVEGPFNTSYKRGRFFKEQFCIIEPVEYILDEKSTFQYVPILKTLSQVLQKNDKMLKNVYSSRSTYETFCDGSHFKENSCLSGDDERICLILYIDDFEVCNPLGTSRKKHKITAVYWVLANIRSILRSSLTSIYLAVLCKANDAKKYGFSQVLEPLLTDLKSLEEDGVFVSSLGRFIKGTVFCVIADNLGAHAVGGFLENFTGSHICRFCTGERSQFQKSEVRSGAFSPRTKQEHELHVQTALSTSTSCYGVKRQCPITDWLNHFHVVSGYPPDVLHDLLEGIVPFELALCLDALIKKRYFSLSDLNKQIKMFPYKWSDRTNSPQSVAPNFASKKNIGGNAHENWCLLRLLSLMVGDKIPEDDKAWQLIMTLKDVVDLALSPAFSDASLGFLDSKISEHRYRFLELFPQEKLLPKHHFLEHYPQAIRDFGPLVALWTMRFEAKHRFFKRVLRQTGCFRNVLMSLARKHQSMIAFHLYDSDHAKPAISVTSMTKVPLEVLDKGIKETVKEQFPNVTAVHVANKIEYFGTMYSVGMMLAYGSTGGLADFAEIVQMIVVLDKLSFVVRLQSAWYNEHLRCFTLEATRNIQILQQAQLTDLYPLAAYTVAGQQMVSLKHFICID